VKLARTGHGRCPASSCVRRGPRHGSVETTVTDLGSSVSASVPLSTFAAMGLGATASGVWKGRVLPGDRIEPWQGDVAVGVGAGIELHRHKGGGLEGHVHPEDVVASTERATVSANAVGGPNAGPLDTSREREYSRLQPARTCE
jgi:hypothetical protein